MTFKSALFVPNFSLYMMTGIIVLWALILDVLVVPAGETLFDLQFLGEFILVFAGLMAVIIFVYYEKHGCRENLVRAFHWVAAFVAIYVVLCLCCNVKSIIFTLPPSHLDEAIIRIEEIVHLGFLPNVAAAHWLEDRDWLYVFLDTVYTSWFFVIFIYLCFVILGNPDSRTRERYIFSFAALWFIAGNLVAIAASSVGPVFLDDFFIPSPKEEEFQAVVAAAAIFEKDTVNLTLAADFFKTMLLGFAGNSVLVDPNGPSAMPSLHVGVAALMVCHSYKIGKAFCGLMFVYFLLVLAGSIALQWHYAIDGYVAMATALVIWKLSGFLPSPREPVLALSA